MSMFFIFSLSMFLLPLFLFLCFFFISIVKLVFYFFSKKFLWERKEKKYVWI
jgi:hypothetical protein